MPASASSNSDWPLPATPAMPTISPALNWNETSSTRVTPRSSRTVKPARLQHDLAGMRGPLVDLENDLAADHRVGEFGRGSLRGLERRNDFAAPHHRDAIRQAHDLAQLVGDEDDRLVLRFQHAQHLEQLVGLGRGQHGGRLVENEDFRAAHQRLQNFDALLQADRKFADDRVGIDLERVLPCKMRELRADRRGAAGEQRPALGARA